METGFDRISEFSEFLHSDPATFRLLFIGKPDHQRICAICEICGYMKDAVRVPIGRLVGMMFGETDGAVLTEFQNFQNFVMAIVQRFQGKRVKIRFASWYRGGRAQVSCLCLPITSPARRPCSIRLDASCQNLHWADAGNLVGCARHAS
jgi:hypothetical protein